MKPSRYTVGLFVAGVALLTLTAAKPLLPALTPKATISAKDKPVVDIVTVDGAIQPISAQVISQAIDRAEREKREAVVIVLDTPGGLDTAMREIVKRITFAVPGVPAEAIQPVGIAITRDRKLAFVALGPANRVAVIDAQSYEVLKYLLVGQRVWSLAFNPDQSRVYTTNGVSNDISVIDVASLKVIKSVPVGQLPWGVVSRP